jgi:hypothetical protein
MRYGFPANDDAFTSPLSVNNSVFRQHCVTEIQAFGAS